MYTGTGRLTQIGTTIEGRIRILERQIADANIEIDKNKEAAQKGLADLRSEVRTGFEAHRTEISSLAKKLEEAMVGGVHYEYVGVWLVIVGSILSVFS